MTECLLKAIGDVLRVLRVRGLIWGLLRGKSDYFVQSKPLSRYFFKA